jgi:4-amino-4-deoxychorismate lyase
MSRVFETIKIFNKKPKNLIYHWERIKWTFKEYYKTVPFFNLKQFSECIDYPDGILKLKIIYDDTKIDYQITQYKRKRIDYFYIIESNDLDYKFKYEDRSTLEKFCKYNYGEPIFVKKRFITDTTFSNIAFFDGFRWYTPSTYLLKGTKRSYLIDNGLVLVDDISILDLKYFKKISIINSMNDLNEFCFDINKIIY